MSTTRVLRGAAIGLLLAAGATGVVGCSTGHGVTSGEAGTIRVVAAENFWGSIAAQLGGDKVTVTSIIDSPDADPHDYEPTTADGRAVATADLVLVNGIGYDTWASKLAAANPVDNRILLTVGDIVGVADGGNPHRWYNPADVRTVVDEITRGYQRIDPGDSAYFARQKAAFETTATAAYQAMTAEIRTRYAGTKVGASESIFAMLAPALGLDLVTPGGFLTAVSQGIDPAAADKATIDAQISNRVIKVYVYNAQNATPDVQAQIAAAKSHGIQVTTITETMTPATVSWQQWQTAQLTALRDALAAAAR